MESLTDPSVRTENLCIDIFNSFGNFLFGDGNTITEAFNVLPVQHMCNKYCEWFKLPSLQPESNPDAQAE